MKRTPVLLQMEAVECGAAALGILLRHYGRYVSLEELRQACNVSRDGASVLSIVRAAQSYGLEAAGLRRSTFTGVANLPAPFIIFAQGNHFAVFEGYDDTHVFLNDPSFGHRTLTHSEFMAFYTGVLVTCQPNSTFERRGRPFDASVALRRWLTGSLNALLGILTVTLLLLIPGFMLPVLLRIFVDDVLTQKRVPLEVVIFGLGCALVLRLVLLWLQQRMLLQLEMRLAVRETSAFFKHLLGLPFTFFVNRYSGDLAYRLQINDRIAGLLTHDIAETVLSLVLMLFYGAVMLTYNIPLTLITICFVGINFGLLRAVARRQHEMSDRLNQQRAQLIGTTLNGLRALETLKATGGESALFNRWASLDAAAISTEQTLTRLTQGYFALIPLLLAVNTTLVLLLGANFVISGVLTLGTLVAFQSLVFSFIQPIGQLAAAGTQIQSVRSDLNRVDDILHYPLRVLPSPTPPIRQPRVPVGQLDIQGLTFGFNPHEPPLIDNFSISLMPGTITVIQGATGSGKSTLARLIAGLYIPRKGMITLSGYPIYQQPHAIGHAGQSITLFAGTFRDNLTLWDNTLLLSDLVCSARGACVHDLIMARGGYDAVIAENGRDLSGGQRQCLEIARVLAHNPLVLILDETTSALDPQTEARVMANIRRRGCICLIVTHRADVLALADESITLGAVSGIAVDALPEQQVHQ